MNFILGKKIEMTQIFNPEGDIIPVTLVKIEPCEITQIKTKEKDGYDAVQIGMVKIKEKKIKKSQLKKPFKFIREFRKGVDFSKYKVGEKIDISIFNEGDKVKVVGTSKGKGFQGAVKKWGFKGRPKTHGTKHEVRGIGSIGAATPTRVVKGRKMPGRMGGRRITVQNLRVVKVDKENNILALKGAIPGPRGKLVEICTQI